VSEQIRFHGGRALWTWPIVIPPIYSKENLIRAFVPEVWVDSRRVLGETDRLVFFGYSLPALDIQAEKLFQRAFTENKQLPHVDVVNRAPASAERYASLSRLKPVRWYPSISSFLDGAGLD